MQTEIEFLVDFLLKFRLSPDAGEMVKARISVLEQQKNSIPALSPNTIQLSPYISPYGPTSGTVSFQDICDHDYPGTWQGTMVPTCTRCGKMAPYGTTSK